MASGVNKVILIGNLGRDPEVRYTPSGQPVANFSIATGETWVDKQGQRQERTEWHRIVVWGKMAEVCGEYLSRGRQVYVEGRLRTRQWDDRDGNKRYTTEIEALQVTFLGGRGEAPAAGAGRRPTVQEPAGGGAPSGNMPPPPDNGGYGYGPPPPGVEDDVPF